MISTIFPSQMKITEQNYFASGVKSIDLMERAALGLALIIERRLKSLEGKRVVFLCGSGGNGGDGFAAARIIKEKGAKVIIAYNPLKSFTDDALVNFNRVKDLAYVAVSLFEAHTLPTPDLWVDCIFGTGFYGELPEEYYSLAERVESDRLKGVPVIACDCPSGLNAKTGKVLGVAFKADTTVSFHKIKTGLVMGAAKDYVGELVVKSIGIDERFEPEKGPYLIEKADTLELLLPRKSDTHKGTYGHLLIIAGSVGMAGAAAICARAAVNAGSGLVTVACPKSIVNIIQVLEPSAMCLPLDEENGAVSGKALPIDFNKYLAVVIGPGLSLRASARVVEGVLNSEKPAVIDADALNIIAQNNDLLALLNKNHVITPHPGELKRLINNDVTDYFEAVKGFNCTVLLKGSSTVISGEDNIFISQSGTPAMAKGGMGDALAGIIGAFLANGISPVKAAYLGSEVHGLAGERAALLKTQRSITPFDLINSLFL